MAVEHVIIIILYKLINLQQRKAAEKVGFECYDRFLVLDKL